VRGYGVLLPVETWNENLWSRSKCLTSELIGDGERVTLSDIMATVVATLTSVEVP
jgi:hypothetical protein